LTRKAALAAGLVLHNIELSQLLRTDLVLSVPEKVNISKTMFHFFNKWKSLEFRSCDCGVPFVAGTGNLLSMAFVRAKH
jgi:hypothetical protein